MAYLAYKEKAKDRSVSTTSAMPQSVKLLAWSRAVRWVGWGFGESLIPIFILGFTHTFAEAGLMRAVVDIAALLALPVVGALADRMSARKLILIGLAVYPLVGLAYYFAGVFGMAIFIVIARALNGLTWEFEDMGINTYYNRVAPKDSLASAFGYIDTWANLGWIAAALVGILLLPFVPIHTLLLMIAPFSIFALLMARRVPPDTPTGTVVQKPGLLGPYKDALRECRSWSRHLWLLCSLDTFQSIISVLMWFFIPLDAYIEGAKPALVVLMMVVATIPSLFGYVFGRFADKGNKYVLLSAGLLFAALVMAGMAAFPSFASKLVASFLLSLLLEFLSVIQQRLVASLGKDETYGERQGAFGSITTLSGLAAPLLVGALLDSLGFSTTSILLAAGCTLFAIQYFFLRKGAPEC